ncbi:MAG: hypothetical protein AB7N80_07715 [Bdellovibrionales bacterium]
MVHNIIFKLVLASSLVWLVACDNFTKRPPQVSDKTREFLGQTENTIYRYGNTALTIGQDGHFDLHYDGFVRNFSYEENSSSEANARCGVNVSGSFKILRERGASGPFDTTMRVYVDKVEVLTSVLVRSGQISTTAPVLCQEFGEMIQKTREFNWELTGYSASHIQLARLSFSQLKDNKWVFISSSYNHAGNTDELSQGGYRQIYLVKDGAIVDVTEDRLAIFPPLSKDYQRVGYPTDLLIDQKNKTMSFLNKTCGLNYNFLIKMIYHDKEELKIVLVDLEHKAQLPDESTFLYVSECKKLKEYLDSMALTPMPMRYNIWTSRDDGGSRNDRKVLDFILERRPGNSEYAWHFDNRIEPESKKTP